MRSTFSTPFDEEYAKRCISLAFPELGWMLVVRDDDPPDLSDIDKSISVEVVRAVTKEDAELSNTYAQYSNRNIRDVPPKLLRKVENKHAGLICDDKDNIIGAGFPVKHDLCGIIKERIIRKTEVLNSDRYPYFETDCVFVYNSDGFCFKNELLKLMQEIEYECKRFSRQFKIIFIYCAHEMYLCNQEKKTVKAACISDNEIELMKKDTLISIGRGEEYKRKSDFIIKK